MIFRFKMTRKQKIQKLKEEGKTLDEIGKEFDITGERVRQILEPEKELKYCEDHETSYEKECEYCKIEEEYPKFLEEDSLNWYNESVRLRKADRSKKTTLMKKILINFLYFKKDFSPQLIAHHLKRDRTTIVHHIDYDKQQRKQNGN